MIDTRMARRGLMAVGASLLIAGCALVPKGHEPTPAPPPAPSDTLPSDKQRHRIALLVPLSGADGAMGQSIANSTAMALLDTGATNLRITTYDTAQGPAAAASKAMRDGNRLVLGPLSSADIPAVTAITRAAKVPVIAYTADPDSAAHDVFVLGVSPASAINRVVRYAHARGVRRFALLAPSGAYGARAASAYASVIQSLGASLVTTQSYDRSNNSIVSAATRLKAHGGFDAVLIADSGKYAALAAPQLKARDGTGPRILGTDLWSGEAAISKTAALRGAWFAALSEARFARYSSSYQARFGRAPYRLSTYGYDSVLLTVRIARDWRAGAPFPSAMLVDRDGFLGLDGPFRFALSGQNERALEVREARAGGVTILSPAPDRFGS